MKLVRMLSWCLAAALVLVVAPLGRAQEAVLEKVPQNTTVFVVMKDVTGLDGKLSDLIKNFMPQPPPGPEGAAAPAPEAPKPLTEMLKQMLGKPELVKAGSPLVLLVRMETFGQQPDMAALVDVTDFKALVGEAQPDADGLYQFRPGDEDCYCAQYQGLVLVGPKAGVAAFKKAPAGVKLTDAQKQLWTGTDAFALVNLAALMQCVAPMYEGAHAQALDELKKLEAAETPAPAVIVAAVKSSIQSLETLWAYGGELDWAAVSGTIEKEAVDLQMALGVKPGGKFSACLNGHPALGAKLTPALPEGDNWAAVWYSVDAKKAVDGMMEYFTVLENLMKVMPAGPMSAPGQDPAEMAKFMASMRDAIKKNAMLLAPQGAVAVASSPQALLAQMACAYKVADPAAYRQQMEDYCKTMKDTMKNLMPGVPGAAMPEMEVAYERDVQKVGDLSVDRTTMKMKFPAEAPKGEPDMSAILKLMYGGDTLTAWCAFTDGHALMVLGPSPEPLAKLAETVKAGGGLGESPEVAALRKFTLSDANAVGFVSLSSCVHTLLSAVTGAMGVEMPPAPAVKVKSAVSVALGQDRAALRMHIPIAEAKQMVESFMALQMAMMQGAMQQGMEAQPAPAPGEQPKEPQPEKTGEGKKAI